MKLGVALPFIDIAVGGDPAAIREFAQTAEEIGYQDLAAPDHVLGVNVASRPDWGDGWMPLNYAPGDEAVAAFDKLRAMAEAAGRDPASIGFDTRTTVGIGAEAEWRETVRFWKSCGVTHLTLGTYSGRGHLRRIDGRTLADHLAAIKRYWNAVADLL